VTAAQFVRAEAPHGGGGDWKLLEWVERLETDAAAQMLLPCAKWRLQWLSMSADRYKHAGHTARTEHAWRNELPTTN